MLQVLTFHRKLKGPAGGQTLKTLWVCVNRRPSEGLKKRFCDICPCEYVVTFEGNCADEKYQNPGGGSDCAALHHGLSV